MCFTKNKLFLHRKQIEKHWLDPATKYYDVKFVNGVKDIMNVCVLFLFYPVFWALFEQIVSKDEHFYKYYFENL